MTKYYYGDSLSVNQILKLPFFGRIKLEYLEKISKILVLRKFEKGEYIIREGNDDKSMYFVLSGTANVLKKSYKGNDQIVGKLYENQSFGEMSFVDEGNRSASVIADSEVIAAELKWDDLQQTFAAKPDGMIQIFKSIAKTLSLRVRQVNATCAKIKEGKVFTDII